MEHASYSRLSSADVIAMCEPELQKRKKQIEIRIKNTSILLADAENRWTRRLNALRKVFFLKPLPLLTYDQAREKLQAAAPKWYYGDKWGTEKWRIMSRGSYWWDEVQQLYNCAKAKPDAYHYVAGDLLAFITKPWADA